MKGQTTSWVTSFSHKFMAPALIVLLVSSTARGLAGVFIGSLVTSYGPYYLWPLLIRLPIELVVFVGISIAAEVCFTATNGNVDDAKTELKTFRLEPMPKFRGTSDQIAKLAESYTKDRNVRLREMDNDLKTERRCRFTFGFISVYYGLNFVIQAFLPLPKEALGVASNVSNGVTDLLSIVIVPYVLWFYSSRYHVHEQDRQSRAQGIVESAIDGRLKLAETNMSKGTINDEDVAIADAVLPKGHAYKPFVRAMKRPPAADEVMTVKDAFYLLHLDDQTLQRWFRRQLDILMKKGTAGVWKEPVGNKDEWRFNGTVYVTIAKQLEQHLSVNPLNPHSRQRPIRATSTGQSPAADQQSGAMQPDQSPPDSPPADAQDAA